MNKQEKKKEGIARLMELAGTKKAGLTAACTLSVLSSLFRIFPYFTIYATLKMLIDSCSSGSGFSFETALPLILMTAASAILYGVCAYSSAILSHGAAFDILYELRMKLMEKWGGSHQDIIRQIHAAVSKSFCWRTSSRSKCSLPTACVR